MQILEKYYLNNKTKTNLFMKVNMADLKNF